MYVFCLITLLESLRQMSFQLAKLENTMEKGRPTNNDGDTIIMKPCSSYLELQELDGHMDDPAYLNAFVSINTNFISIMGRSIIM